VSIVTTPPDELVVLDGRVTDEKVAELLDLQNEHPRLDFKRRIDLKEKADVVELAKDCGAMEAAGGYVVIGADDDGVPTGDMDGCNAQSFDEANLVPKLQKYLPEPLTIRARVTTQKGHTVVVIFVAPHPDGYAVFKADGQYERDGDTVTVFRQGDIFWRNGTRSEKISQRGLQEAFERRVALEKAAWMEEQNELRRRERQGAEAGLAAREVAKGALVELNLGLPPDELRIALLEILSAGDKIRLLYLLNDARPRAASAIERDEIETELAELLDKLAVIATVALEYEQDELFERVIGVFTQIYSLPVGQHDDRRFGLSTSINPAEKAPRVFLQVLDRVYALGALAVRLNRWEAVRQLTLQFPDRLDDYWKNWLRHGQVMASRAQQLSKAQDGREIQISLLSRAAELIQRESTLRPDTGDEDEILTSLTQFDLLSNLAAIDGADSTDSAVFYTNFARFRQDRIEPIAERVLTDAKLRHAIFRDHDDSDLAVALQAVARMAHSEGGRYDGFWGWNRTPVGEFIAKHAPSSVT
jgi:hypothetical protein